MAHGRALILREGQPAPQEFGNHRPQQNLKNMTMGTTETQQEQGEDDDFPRDPRTGRYQNVFYNYSGTYSTHIWVGGRSIHLWISQGGSSQGCPQACGGPVKHLSEGLVHYRIYLKR